jgi:pentatricopeptide repeat protein
MTPLAAPARDAGEFADWARGQGCTVTLLTDVPRSDGTPSRVTVSDVFTAVEAVVESRTYDQLILYFSGHGILLSPGAEYWLLSGGPANPNEAINLLRSVEDARNSGIPHVVFVSDACRSAADSPVLRAVTGGVVFPTRSTPARRSEIDVYFATLPGDPANEAPEPDATRDYRGLFTRCLLDVVANPPSDLPEPLLEAGVPLSVLSSRRLKGHLEGAVPVAATAVSIKLRQSPEVRVETALPQYFADVTRLLGGAAPPAPPAGAHAPTLTVESALGALRAELFRDAAPSSPVALDRARDLGFVDDVTRLVRARGRASFETRTGFSVHGATEVAVAVQRWGNDPPFQESAGDPAGFGPAIHVRLHPRAGVDSRRPSSIVLQFDGDTGTILPVLPGFIGTVVVDRRSVISVSFVPAAGTSRFPSYEQRAPDLEAMKAFAAVASRKGRFEIEREHAAAFADRIRQDKGIDPTMGLYAAYAYAQAGRFEDAYSVFTYMRQDEIELPIPFDVVMLALRHQPNALAEPFVRVAPFAPMLAQGWSLLLPRDPMHLPVHAALRPHLVPALFTTLTREGVAIASHFAIQGKLP